MNIKKHFFNRIKEILNSRPIEEVRPIFLYHTEDGDIGRIVTTDKHRGESNFHIKTRYGYNFCFHQAFARVEGTNPPSLGIRIPISKGLRSILPENGSFTIKEFNEFYESKIAGEEYDEELLQLVDDLYDEKDNIMHG